MLRLFCLLVLLIQQIKSESHGLLYPRESETREVRSLDGIWTFYKSNPNDPMQGVREAWYKHDLSQLNDTMPMPVPASYNDISTEQILRDHVGTVWYERTFFAPKTWSTFDTRIWLRFGSVHYSAIVWLNGQQVMSHSIGHLPFEAEISNLLVFGMENRLTVLCDNTLINSTIPQGAVVQEPSDNGDKLLQTYTFDFFNYAGIHRSVHLYTTPAIYIQDITVTTNLIHNNSIGLVDFEIMTNGNEHTESNIVDPQLLYVRTQLLDKNKVIVCSNLTKVGERGLRGQLVVENVRPWWPYLMHDQPGYLYTLEVFLYTADNRLMDVYRLKLGIRTLAWNDKSLLLNGMPLYLHGFGRHEDSDIRGKGLDNALIVRDFNLLKWIGANAYRTSHYPYSEESMQFADEHGIMIIDECPSVNTDIFQAELLKSHESALEQLIHRDRNHASVIMWSIANEPRSANNLAELYFAKLTNFTRGLDNSRPLTAAINVNIDKDKLAQFLDIISFNRYNAWYQNPGQLDTITRNVIDEASKWHQRYKKPIIMSEYGADTLEGLHYLPTYIWAEDYQCALLTQHFKAFDELRKQKWFIGEFVWNFADFKTEETYNRVGGNKKGIFTRNRQPKSAAYLLRQRYYALAMQLYEIIVPHDVFTYIIDWTTNAKN